MKQMNLAIPAAFVVAVAGVATGAILLKGNNEDRMVEATLGVGSPLVAALERTVSTKSSGIGDPIRLEVVEPVPLGEEAELSVGAVIRGEVVESKGGGRIAGAPELALRFTELEVNGESYRISAHPFRVRGEDHAGKSALQIGGGAAAGGVIGAVVGGGRGAVRGAVVGGVIGTGVAIATDGDDLVLPAGQRLRIRLAEPVTMRVKRLSRKD